MRIDIISTDYISYAVCASCATPFGNYFLNVSFIIGQINFEN